MASLDMCASQEQSLSGSFSASLAMRVRSVLPTRDQCQEREAGGERRAREEREREAREREARERGERERGEEKRREREA